ncbi:MAG: hypothetical protein AAF533_21315 [Acidobacteriota bacterium]
MSSSPLLAPREGRLGEPETLPLLLVDLARAEWSGALCVRSGDVERRLYLTDGRVQTYESDDPTESTGAFVLGEGLVDENELERALAHLRIDRHDPGLVRRLVPLGLLEEEQLPGIEMRQLLNGAAQLFQLRTGEYQCRLLAAPGDARLFGLEVASIVAASMIGSWEDAWAMNLLGGGGTVLQLEPERLCEYEATGAEELYDLTLLRVDGKTNVSELIANSGLPESAALRFLAACRLLGCVTPAISSREPAGPGFEAHAPSAAPAAPQAPAAPSLRPAPAAAQEPELVETHDDSEAAAAAHYRPVARPQPRTSDLMTEEPSGGTGRLLVLLAIALLVGALGFAAWKGWKELSASPAVESPTRTDTPESSRP